MTSTTFSLARRSAEALLRTASRRRGAPATALALIGLVLALAPAAVSHAQAGFLYEWDEPAGGAYASNANWTPSGIPDASNEGARFNLNATYSVQLPASFMTVKSLEVAQGNVSLSLPAPPAFSPAYTYTANGSFPVGSTGQASLDLTRFRLTTGAATLGMNAGSDGRLKFDRFGAWNTTGAAVIGGAGSGSLTLLAGVGSSFIGQPVVAQADATNAGAVLGQSAAGSGTATIHGRWHTGDLIVGDAGDAEINLLATSVTVPTNLSSVGRLDSGAASIAAQPGSTGTVNVTASTFGPGFSILASDWIITGSLSLGGVSASPGGAGRLAIGTFNEVAVGSDLRIWPGGVLSLRELGELTVNGAANLGGALEFLLAPTTNPQLGNEFQILSAIGGVAGTFGSTILPPLGSGLAWTVLYNPTSVALKVISAPSFAADFDADGDVDGADLTKWKTGFGTTGTATHMQGDADGDLDVDGGDFLVWQQQMGSPASVAAAAQVPEPMPWVLTAVALTALALAVRPRPVRPHALVD